MFSPEDQDGYYPPTVSEVAKGATKKDLKEGFLIVMPARPVALAGTDHFAWWRLDPATGATLGILENGYHGTATEYQEKNAKTEEQIKEMDSGLSFFRRLVGIPDAYREPALGRIVKGAFGLGYDAGLAEGTRNLAGAVFAALALGAAAGFIAGHYSTAPPPPPAQHVPHG